MPTQIDNNIRGIDRPPSIRIDDKLYSFIDSVEFLPNHGGPLFELVPLAPKTPKWNRQKEQ